MDPGPTTTDERRTAAPSFTLLDGLAVEVLVPLAGDHLVFSGRGRPADRDDGHRRPRRRPHRLTVAMVRRCVLVWGEEGAEQCALVRNGRRVDDVHSPTTIELVLEEVRPLADVVE